MAELRQKELENANNYLIKLEELMYLSLIGKFDYIHKCDNKTYICFTTTDERVNKDFKLKPVYITSLEIVSDRIARSRITAFEKKIFNEEFANFIDRNESEAKCILCFSRRMKDYINNYYLKSSEIVQKDIENSYKTNIINLNKENILDNAQFEAANEFVTRQLFKINEKIN